MKHELIIEIALEKILGDLCVKWYLEQNEEIKQEIYDNEIIPLYKKVNNM